MTLRFASLRALEKALGKKPSISQAFDNPSEKRKTKKKTNPKVLAGNKIPCDLLWAQVLNHYEDYSPVREFKGAIPGRRFSLDIAFPQFKICIEMDGWAYHGRLRSIFTHDRQRQNLLSIQGWTILRYSTKQVFQEMPSIVEQIGIALHNARANGSHCVDRGGPTYITLSFEKTANTVPTINHT